MRVSVSLAVKLLNDGVSCDEIIEEYPDLEQSLHAGAMVVVEDSRCRVRVLPITN